MLSAFIKYVIGNYAYSHAAIKLIELQGLQEF
jgi:hypothetical protein